jgi:hypothetical protein
MPKALPSIAVKLIDAFFPWASSGPPKSQVLVTYANAPGISGLVELVERLPEETLQLSSDEYSHALWAVASLKHIAKRIEGGTTSAGGGWPLPSFGTEDTISLLRRLLSKCPDEGIKAGTANLPFIGDDDLRSSVRLDISSSQTALNNGEWKAATVLAGSALEALLLWRIQQHNDSERQSAVSQTGRKVDPKHPENWYLADHIEVAHALSNIGDDTASLARLAKDFRNLIHPGREQRTQIRCDRGTAHAAFAALHLVIGDFEKPAKGSP